MIPQLPMAKPPVPTTASAPRGAAGVLTRTAELPVTGKRGEERGQPGSEGFDTIFARLATPRGGGNAGDEGKTPGAQAASAEADPEGAMEAGEGSGDGNAPAGPEADAEAMVGPVEKLLPDEASLPEDALSEVHRPAEPRTVEPRPRRPVSRAPETQAPVQLGGQPMASQSADRPPREGSGKVQDTASRVLSEPAAVTLRAEKAPEAPTPVAPPLAGRMAVPADKPQVMAAPRDARASSGQEGVEPIPKEQGRPALPEAVSAPAAPKAGRKAEAGPLDRPAAPPQGEMAKAETPPASPRVVQQADKGEPAARIGRQGAEPSQQPKPLVPQVTERPLGERGMPVRTQPEGSPAPRAPAEPKQPSVVPAATASTQRPDGGAQPVPMPIRRKGSLAETRPETPVLDKAVPASRGAAPTAASAAISQARPAGQEAPPRPLTEPRSVVVKETTRQVAPPTTTQPQKPAAAPRTEGQQISPAPRSDTGIPQAQDRSAGAAQVKPVEAPPPPVQGPPAALDTRTEPRLRDRPRARIELPRRSEGPPRPRVPSTPTSAEPPNRPPAAPKPAETPALLTPDNGTEPKGDAPLPPAGDSQPFSETLRSSAPRTELARHVATQISQQALRTGEGGTELQLDPKELGRVTLRMATEEHGVMLQITAERSETGELMRRHISLLQDSFRALGFERVEITINGRQIGAGFGSAGQGAAHSGGQAHGQAQDQPQGQSQGHPQEQTSGQPSGPGAETRTPYGAAPARRGTAGGPPGPDRRDTIDIRI
ncbi:hook-length control protein FliK [Pseudooceanicola antarcticus]|nr:hook-length control protein FliK [Pseudooceanicola antarcticus]